MARNDTVRGLVRVVQSLERGEAVSVDDVQRETGLNDAAARRHWKRLPDLVPGIRRTQGSGRAEVWIHDDAPPGPREWQAIAMGFARQALAPLHGSPVMDALDTLAKAAFARLTDDERARAKGVSPLFHVVPSGSAAQDRAEVVGTLSEAWLRSRRCDVHYIRSDGSEGRRELEPLGLLLRGDHLLLVARVPGEKGRPRRHLRVDRIVAVSARSRGFARPDLSVFNPAEHLEEAWGVTLRDDLDVEDVRVVFRGVWAVLTEHFKIHPSQAWASIDSDDGVPRASVTWRVAPCDELTNFLLSTVPNLERVEPPALRDAVRNRLAEGLRQLDENEDLNRRS